MGNDKTHHQGACTKKKFFFSSHVLKLLWYHLISLSSFWQLACHCKHGGKSKLEWPCEDDNIHKQFSATRGPPHQPHFPDPSHASTSPACKEEAPHNGLIRGRLKPKLHKKLDEVGPVDNRPSTD